MLFLSIVSTLIGLMTPWVYREIVNFLTEQNLSPFFDRLIPTDSAMGVLWWLVLIFFSINLLSTGTNELKHYVLGVTGMRSNTMFAQRTLEKLQLLSVAYFDKTSPGWVRERIFSGIREIFGILRSIIADVLPLLVTLVTAAVVLWLFNPLLASVLIVVAPVYVWVSVWRARVMRFWQKKIRTQFERRGKAFLENVSYYQLIREFAQEDFELNRLAGINHRLVQTNTRLEKFLRWSGFAREVLAIVAYVWVYGYGGCLVLQGQVLVGDLILFVIYLQYALGPLGRVMMLYDSVQVGLVSTARLFGIWDTQVQVADVPDAKRLTVREGGIEFKQVGFAYRGSKKHMGEREVFKNFSLTINPRETVAVVGPSGVGKSTLVKLLLRFYDPNHGQILIDGQDIGQVQQKSLRQNVSVVMQDVITFNSTINYNLRYGRPKATRQEIANATKVANLYQFIGSLRYKFQTKIGERGVRLSGGEKQRLAIARALLKDAPILVMDEATSALDSENEQMIQDAMWQLIEGRTAIIIAHRLSTVKRADRIVVLQDGKIVEQGSHEELMKRSGYYRRLFKMQGEMLAE